MKCTKSRSCVASLLLTVSNPRGLTLTLHQIAAQAQLDEETNSQAGIREKVDVLHAEYDELEADTKVRLGSLIDPCGD